MAGLFRFGGVLPVALGAASVFVGLNVGLLAFAGPKPEWLVPRQTPTGWGEIETAERRALGLIRKMDGDIHEAAPPLLVYVGMSTAREGIDPGLLSNALDGAPRVFGVTGSGAGMDQLSDITAPLLRSGVRPATVVLCLHPAWLVGHPTEDPPSSINPVRAALGRNWVEASNRLKWLNWLARNRLYINNLGRRTFHEARVKIGGFAADPDPLGAPQRLGYPRHASPGRLRRQLDGFDRFGWFDAAMYPRHGREQIAALIGLMQEFKEMGSNVVVVLMPEQAALRDKIPSVAEESLRAGIASSFEAGWPVILDLQDTVPDSMFSDYCHLNDEGRLELSRQLGVALRERMRASAPAPPAASMRRRVAAGVLEAVKVGG